MKALITGASSGIGRDMARVLSHRGYDLILVARNEQLLKQVKKKCKTKVKIIVLDLSKEDACFSLYSQVKHENIDILINNAGFGIFGEFAETSLKGELNMIDLNIKAVHILTKLFLKDFKTKNHGAILNVASSAAFLPGPMMATYYATKAYILRLTQGIHEELRQDKSKVYIGALCPGPVETGFNDRAGVKFVVKGLKSVDVANYAVKQMFHGKVVIIPGNLMKITKFMNRFVPDRILVQASYHIQKRKKY